LVTVTVERVGRLEKGVGLMGIGRVSFGSIKAANGEVIKAEDLELKTISAINILSMEVDMLPFGSLTAPGSINNSVTLSIRNIATAGAPVAAVGSHRFLYIATE